jgi:hypothetical protein
LDVISNSGATTKNYAVSYNSTPSYADLCADKAMFTDSDVVPDLHLVVDLGVRSDGGCSDGGAVNRGARSDLNVIANNSDTNLRDLADTHCAIRNIPKSICSNHCVVMNYAIVSDHTSFAHYDTAMKMCALTY